MQVLYRLSYVGPAAKPGLNPNQVLRPSIWSGKRGSNPRPSAWKADALPTELFPLRNVGHQPAAGTPPAILSWWGGEDSNLRRRTPTDLQSVPFDRSGTPPETTISLRNPMVPELFRLESAWPVSDKQSVGPARPPSNPWRVHASETCPECAWSWREDLNPQPPHYK